MANPEHINLLRRGVAPWNDWRRSHPEVVPDLMEAGLRGLVARGINLRGARLRWSDLSRSDLSGADLSEVNLREADLSEAYLRQANCRAADLGWANLNSAALRDADLRGADLVRTMFIGTELSGVNVTGAHVGWTTWASTDLSEVVGLADVQHRGPSSIGIDTLAASLFKIPPAFLRGAGVPSAVVESLRSALVDSSSFFSIFISYSTLDQAFADHLYADLQARGVRCWFAPHDIQGGRKIQQQIEEAIRVHDKLLLILSDASMDSTWVKSEVANARGREIRQKRQILFPISLVPYDRIVEWKLFDADTGIDSAREIREYFIPDFSNWKDHDSYAKAFERLLRDLKAEQGPRADGKPGG